MMAVREISLVVVVESWLIGSIIAVLSLVYIILNIRLRNTRLIKMSSPNLNILVGAGGLLSSITCVLFGVDYFIPNQTNQVSSICQLRAAFLTCSFSLLFGPLLAKCWRVYRIFEQASLKRVVIRDSRLLVFIAVLLLSDVIIISIWQLIDPLQYTDTAHISQIVPDNSIILPQLPVVIVRACNSNHIAVWLIILVVSKSPILIAGLFLAWKTRDVMLPSMNDSFAIIVSTLTTVAVSAIIFTIGGMYQDNPDVIYGSFLFGIGICSVVTTSMVFVPKLLLWWKNPEKAALRVSISSKSAHNVTGIQTVDQLEDNMYNVVAENKTMKKCLHDKDVAINDLQTHLNNAQKKLIELTLEQEARQDSGLEIDLSSSSGQEESEVSTSVQVSPSSLNHTSPSSVPAIRMIIQHETPRQPSLKSYHSSSSVQYTNLCRLRDSIAEDITQASNLSSNIRNSISRDIDKVEKVSRRKSFRYESLKSRQELAGSIAQSYNLGDSGDTYKYVSSCVSSVSNLEHPCRRKIEYSSSESVNNIANDKLYPENQRRRKQRRHGRHSDLNKCVYTIPTEYRSVKSAVTLPKTLGSDSFV